MAIKEKFKNIFKDKLKVISNIVTLIVEIVIFCLWVYLVPFSLIFMLNPWYGIALIIGIIMFTIIFNRYFYSLLKDIKEKKIVKSIIKIILLLIATGIIALIYLDTHNILKQLIFASILIIGIVCFPLIILGINILSKNKFKKIKIFISICALIYIYLFGVKIAFYMANQIVEILSKYSISEIIEMQAEYENAQIDVTYLENYTQKFAKNGYLEKNDIIQILDYTDKKSIEIKVNYIDEHEDIHIYTTNKNDEQMNKLKSDLKANYYKFNYEKFEDNKIIVNIERYNTKNSEKKEKNSEIILSGSLNKDMIENIEKYENDSFVFKNKMKNTEIPNGKELVDLKILFAFDKEFNNYVPVISDKTDYTKIKSYAIYNSGISITLKEGIEVNKKDYTLRLNRYDENMNLLTKENDYYIGSIYYYEYEPVVEILKDSNNCNVLDIRFPNSMSYTSELRNIEIIF